MDQGTRVAADIWPLAARVLPPELAQLVVDERCELIEGAGVASSPGLQESGDVAGWDCSHDGAILCLCGYFIRPGGPLSFSRSLSA